MNKNSGLCISAVIIIVNFALFAVKLYVGLAVSSLSIYTDAMNNLLDCVTGLIAMGGFLLLSKSRNKKYPFGYGRAEDIVSFVMSVVIFLAGCAFAYSSVERILYPTPVAYAMKYVKVICITAVVKLLMAAFLKKQTVKNPSDVIKSIYFDSVLDFFITLSVVLSFTVSIYTGIVIDGIVGLVISIMIAVNGFKLIVPSVKKLMGRRNDDICQAASEFLGSICDGCIVERLECHSYGNKNVFNAVVRVVNESDRIDFSFAENEFEREFLSEIYFRIN